MLELPGGGITVLLVCGVGLLVIVIFVVKEYRFWYHRQRGKGLSKEGDFRSALRHLIRAEKLWMLRLSKQTIASRAEDCRNLGEVLDLIAQAARHCGVKIETRDYREAVTGMEQFFSSPGSPTDYSRIYLHFRSRQKQFRISLQNLRM
jgi:hypothetical protein